MMDIKNMSYRQKLVNWNILSSDFSRHSGAEISKGEDVRSNSIEAQVPTTLLAAMIDSGILQDPREGSAFLKLPGVPEEDVLDNFALREMPEDSPFNSPRWWITSFPFFRDERHRGRKNCTLEIKGINYCGEVWVNGELISDKEHTVGTYRDFSFDISDKILEENNTLAIKVYPPESNSLAFSFVDWHPMPPDKCTGLWRDVNLVWFDGLKINNIFVQNDFNGDFTEADMEISLEIENSGSKALAIHYEISCRYFEIQGESLIQPGRNTLITDSTLHPELLVKSPSLWWPYQLGTPELVEITACIRGESFLFESLTISHGFREISSYLNRSGDRQFTINGVDLLLRGGAWAPDMLLKESDTKDEIDVAYVKDMGLNSIRFEANFGSDNLWDLCDREGILILAGWTCDSFWEQYGSWTKETKEIANESLKSLLRRFRHHASFAAWFYGSDLMAPPDVESMYLETLSREVPDLVRVASAGKYSSNLSGGTGVKMSGPYSYVPPVYWYLEKMPGFACGFNTETGPDVSIPPYESLTRMFSQDDIKIGSPPWLLHTGLRQFRGTEITETAIERRYGTAGSLNDFSKKAQVLSYEAWRAMFEAAARNRGLCTGIIGWMLTNSWPSLIWHLYDSNLYPTGGYYGTKKACSLFHVILDYSEYSLHSVNNSLKNLMGTVVEAELFSIEETGRLELIWSDSFNLDIPANSSVKIGSLPDFTGNSSLYFLFLTLKYNKRIVDRNTYWLSNIPDVMTDNHIQFGTTEIAQYSDFSSLNSLPLINLEAACENDNKGTYTFSLFNNSDCLAFFVEIKLRVNGGFQLLPVLWSDNFISMRPGERVNITARVLFPGDNRDDLVGEISGFNIIKTTVRL